MILAEMRDYLQQRQRVSLLELARHFAVELDAARGMLGRWIAKGRVRRLATAPRCTHGCCQCDPASLELYEWCEPGSHRTDPPTAQRPETLP